MILLLLSSVAFVLAAIPALLFRANLNYYLPPPEYSAGELLPSVSVLIPARNEELSIQAAGEAVLASEGVELELVIFDDQSEDATPTIVRRLADQDARVRLVNGPALPDGWCGKQHACWILSQNASYNILVFLDADVRLAPQGLARMVAFLSQSKADLVSGVPYQETGTLFERLVIPLIHFLLLGFLPIWRMRASRDPAYGAGCGQLFMAKRSSYEKAGGHAAIRTTLHDGIRLPRRFRSVGLTTDLFDATGIARCRMYRGAGELCRGLAKNAVEGLGAPRLIVSSTLLLLLGQVSPIILVLLSIGHSPTAAILAASATAFTYYPRIAGSFRFGQSELGAILHPFGVLVFLSIQWYALYMFVTGRRRGWKGRTYSQTAAGT